MVRQRTLEAVLTAIGAVAVAVGASLPWLRISPLFPLGPDVPPLYRPVLDPGLGGADVVLLGAVGAVLVARFFGGRNRIAALLALLTGVGTVVGCLLLLTPDAGNGLGNYFTPVAGWYLTVVGGLALAAAGTLRFRHHPERSEPATTALGE